MPCLSAEYDLSVGPLIQVLFAQAGVFSDGGGQAQVTSAHLLIDTGASHTCISPQLATQIGLRSLGKRKVGVVSGHADLDTYLADLLIPFGDIKPGVTQTNVQTIPVQNLTVVEYRGDISRYQGVLGRDIIDRGIFSIAGWDRKYYFSL